MRKGIAGVVVTAYALKGSPYAGKCGEEAEKARVGRVALARIIPMPGIQAEEKLEVLFNGQ